MSKCDFDSKLIETAYGERRQNADLDGVARYPFIFASIMILNKKNHYLCLASKIEVRLIKMELII
jgi:hypothetical protein